MPIPPFLANLRQKVGTDLILVPTVVVLARDSLGRLLLVHDRDSARWTLPGGIIEPGETPADAAVREVWEEARLRITVSSLLAVLGGPRCETHYQNGDKIAWVATVFGAKVMCGTPESDGVEVSEAVLVEPRELHLLDLREDTTRFLHAAMDQTRAPYFEAATWQPTLRPTPRSI